MTAREAINTFVHDGDHLVIGNYTVGTCAELVFEVARQGKKGLTLYSQSGVFDVEMLVGAGCIERLVSTYVYRAGGKEGGSAVERALNAGTLLLEDYTNFDYNARLVAGMHGLTFMQVLEGVMVTDLFRKRGFMGEDKFRVIDCPYTGKKILTVPAANPDVCIVHVQRADKLRQRPVLGRARERRGRGSGEQAHHRVLRGDRGPRHRPVEPAPHHHPRLPRGRGGGGSLGRAPHRGARLLQPRPGCTLCSPGRFDGRRPEGLDGRVGLRVPGPPSLPRPLHRPSSGRTRSTASGPGPSTPRRPTTAPP